MIIKRCFFSLTILFLFLFSETNAQDKYTITLKDGRKFTGKAVKTFNRKYVVYKTLEKGKKVKFKEELVYSTERIDHKTGEKEVLYYKKVEVRDNKFPFVVKTITAPFKKHIAGKVEVFILGIHTGIYGGVAKYEGHYVGKPNDDFVVKINYGPKFKKFQKIIDYYFNDCPEIIPKIKNLEFGGNTPAMEGIVKYYNEKCH